MKVTVLMLGLFLASMAQGQSGVPAGANKVPPELLTPDSVSWTISTLSTMGYVNTTPGANYGTYQGGGGMIVKFKFREGGRYEFMLYVKVNTYGYITETWTQVEGTVFFTKDAKGQQIFITKAEKGVYRINKNGEQTRRPITTEELKNQHSKRFLWEKADLKDDTRNTYLLVVDLKEHPGADVNNPQTIDPSWVSKFHIPKGN